MSLKFCTNCGHQLKDGDKVCPCCGATILNDDLSIDEQLDMLKNDDIFNDIKVVDDKVNDLDEEKVKDDRVDDFTETKVKDDRVNIDEETKVTVKDDRKEEDETNETVKDDRKEEDTEKPKDEKVTDDTNNTKDDNNGSTNNDNNEEPVKNKESGITKALKIPLGIISILALLACAFGAFTLEAQGNISMPNFLEYIMESVKALDGSSFSVSVVGQLVFSLVIPVVLIVIYFIKQFVVSIKIFKVGRNTNRGALWDILVDNLVGIFVIKLVSSVICKPCTTFNPLDLLMIPACLNMIFYTFLYFFKLFRNEIGTFKFGKANSGKLVAHRIIQAVAICAMFILCMIMVDITSDGVVYSFKPFYGIRSFINGTLNSYITAEQIVSNTSMQYLFVAVFDFGINLVLMMFEATILVYLLNTVYRFVLRDVEEEYYNDCFFKSFKTKAFTCIVTLITLMVCKFVSIYTYLTTHSDIVIDISFGTCVTYLLPYLIGLGVMLVFTLVNTIISNKWLKQVKE